MSYLLGLVFGESKKEVALGIFFHCIPFLILAVNILIYPFVEEIIFPQIRHLHLLFIAAIYYVLFNFISVILIALMRREFHAKMLMLMKYLSFTAGIATLSAMFNTVQYLGLLNFDK